MVVRIDNVVFRLVLVVAFMPIALMGVKVNYHKLLKAAPQLKVVRYERDVWVNAEATA